MAVNMLLMCRLFGDDNSFQYSLNNILDIKHYLNHDFKILESWSIKWLLKFNPSKTKIVVLWKAKGDPQIIFYIIHSNSVLGGHVYNFGQDIFDNIA